MSDPWYKAVRPEDRLSQGDVIFDCPLLSWTSSPIRVISAGSEVETLKQGGMTFQADVCNDIKDGYA